MTTERAILRQAAARLAHRWATRTTFDLLIEEAGRELQYAADAPTTENVLDGGGCYPEPEARR